LTVLVRRERSKSKALERSREGEVGKSVAGEVVKVELALAELTVRSDLSLRSTSIFPADR